jgi:hypothetical protein
MEEEVFCAMARGERLAAMASARADRTNKGE